MATRFSIETVDANRDTCTSCTEKSPLLYDEKDCEVESNISFVSCASNDEEEDDEQVELDTDEKEVTYFKIVQSNKPFQLYLSSYIITEAGRWFTYVASIELMEEILGPNKTSSSRRYVSYLVICRLLPFLVMAPFGGVLADVRDRRHSMIALDCIAAIVPLLFLFAAYLQSISILFIVTSLQSTIGALYEPARNAIVPLLVPDHEEMKKATTLAGLAWSVVAAMASALGGFMVGTIGIRACFALDSISFIISALLLVLMGGQWDVSTTKSDHISTMQLLQDMTIGGGVYIKTSKFWPIVLIKVTSALVYGGAEVLNVSFSEEGHEVNELESSRRLGALYCCIGIGCFLGPLVADTWTSMKNVLSLFNACIISFALEAIACLGMGYFDSFFLIEVCTVLRSAAASIAWIDSSVLLQSFSKPEMLGRVMAFDYALALTGEAFAAMIAGLMQDDLGFTAGGVSIIMGYVAIPMFTVWLIYRSRNPQFE